MTRKRRLSVFLSVVWCTLTGIVALDSWNPIGTILAVGFLPLLLVWGSWWVLAGSRQDSPSAKHNESQEVDYARMSAGNAGKVDEENLDKKRGSNWVVKAVSVLLVAVAVAASVITNKPTTVDQTNTKIAGQRFFDSLSADQMSLIIEALESSANHKPSSEAGQRLFDSLSVDQMRLILEVFKARTAETRQEKK
jgi:hypothetical protein